MIELPDSAPLVFTAAVEGNLDEAVLRRLIGDSGAMLGSVYGRKGKNHIRDKIQGYNNAANFHQWIVMVDLDEDASCAPDLRNQWLPAPAPHMLFRVAVREIEAWLLGDRDRLARFIHIPRAKVPSPPESLMDAKRAMVDLGRMSSRRDIREDLVPRPGSGRTVGAAYSSRLTEFVTDQQKGWRPEVAAQACDSLRRFINRLRTLSGSSHG